MRRGLRCRISRTPRGDRIEVSGRLTRRSQQRVVGALWRRAWTGGRHITVDLAGVTFFDGTSVIVLLGNKRIVERQRGCTVDVTGLENATRRILAMQ
jgi:anti-anti-sigma regulatory factor